MKKIDIFEDSYKVHKIWHQFFKWIEKKYGKDLYGEPTTYKIDNKEIKIANFDDLELSRRLCGFEVIEKIEWYCKKYLPEIKILRCDDDVHAGSIILLIPHPTMGISIMFIPQCTNVQNRFFLYDQHYEMLIEGLKDMDWVYDGGLYREAKKLQES